MVSDIYGGSAEASLKHALQVPKHDPAPLAALIAAGTTRLGVVATMSTLAYPPFMLARLCSTLDHIAGGRFGWNIVTSGEDTELVWHGSRVPNYCTGTTEAPADFAVTCFSIPRPIPPALSW